VLALLHNTASKMFLVVAGDHDLKGISRSRIFKRPQNFPMPSKTAWEPARRVRWHDADPWIGRGIARSMVRRRVVDTSHGQSRGLWSRCENQSEVSRLTVIGGNIVTAEAGADLVKHGADAVQVCIGSLIDLHDPGHSCVGVPPYHAIARVAKHWRAPACR